MTKQLKTSDYDKSLVNVAAFLPDDKEILEIIKLCHLQPSESWRLWHDNLGNHLNILNDRKVVSYKDLPLSPTTKIITDIHHKAPPDRLANSASQAVIFFGEGDKITSNVAFIWLLGKDGRLRFLTFAKNEWLENHPPLIVGLKTLRVVIKNLHAQQPQTVYIKDLKGPVAATIVKGWATPWPINNNLKLEMLLANKILTSKIIEDFHL